MEHRLNIARQDADDDGGDGGGDDDDFDKEGDGLTIIWHDIHDDDEDS